MKVLRPAPVTENWKAVVDCPRCQAQLEVDESDLVSTAIESPSGPVALVHCPTRGCAYTIVVQVPFDVCRRVPARTL